MTLRYPGLAEVLTLHALLIDAYGGSGELRDAGALQSALAAPGHTMFGEELYPRPADKAAILLYLLIQNHPFVDGNKRTGLATCFRFLEMSGYTVDADGGALYNLAMGVAAGHLTRNEVTAWMQDHLREIWRGD